MSDHYPTDEENFGNVDPEEYERRKRLKVPNNPTGKAPTRESRFHTLLESRAQGWDWLNIQGPKGEKAILYIRKALDNEVQVGIKSSTHDEIRVTQTDGDFDAKSEECAPETRKSLTLRKHDLGWDWLQLDLPGDVTVKIYLARVWYRRISLTVLAPRAVRLRKTDAQG